MKNAVQTAMFTGTEQYVKLGAEHDDFYRSDDIYAYPIFEVETENFADRLLENGFDARKKTIFSWIGESHYLNRDELSDMLANIASLCAEGSSLVFDIDGFSEMEITEILAEHGFLVYDYSAGEKTYILAVMK